MKSIKHSRADYIFDITNYVFLLTVFFLVLYPLYFIVIASISDPVAVNSGKVWALPVGVTFDGYVRIFKDDSILTGYGNTILYTVIGIAINLFCTMPAAYALSRKDLDGRNMLMYLVVFTMFFNGGLISTFILVRNLGIYNSLWALVLPVAVVPWNLIIARTFFQMTIPDELHDAAQIDGCSDVKFFFRIALPLSGSLIAIMVLFYGVMHWNSYFNALIYLSNRKLYPLQLVLRNILIINQTSSEMLENVEQMHKQQTLASLIQFGVIIVSALPLMLLYPFLQKYIVKGVMIGAVKG